MEVVQVLCGTVRILLPNDAPDIDPSRQVECWGTHTVGATHDIVRQNLDKSIHIKETVKGPRYCPSIESKVIRFKEKDNHLCARPEGLPALMMARSCTRMVCHARFLRSCKKRCCAASLDSKMPRWYDLAMAWSTTTLIHASCVTVSRQSG